MKALFVFAVCLMALGVTSAEVKHLKADNFDSTLKDAEVALVKFYAPWCGHCKKLAPEFKTAADMLDGKAILADVNCDDDKDLCAKFDVRGYPTLYIFRNGEKSEDYGGGRTADEIAKFMIANSGPAVTYVSSREEYEKVPVVDGKVLVMANSKDSAIAKAIESIAPSMRSSLSFAIATDKSVADDVDMETVVVYRPDDEKEVFAAGENVDQGELEKFLKRARVPLFGAVGPSTIQMYNDLITGNIGWLFLDKTNRDKMLEAGKAVAKKHRGNIIMLWVDTELYGGVSEQLAVPKGSKFPAFVIDKNRRHHVQPLDQPVNEETMSAFVEKYMKGEVKATVKSEPTPSPETKDGMTTIVGSRLRPLMEESKDKDMMILFYAPWCGHCKTFNPIYEKVAKALEKSEVMIAKMDATANDVDSDEFSVQGFPTIYFVKAGDRTTMHYNGERTFEGVMDFIKENANAKVEHVDEADL